jgi:hypothetical protein
MKKVILIVLMLVMVATPCPAEVELDGIFSIEKTLWGRYGEYFGFYQGNVYHCLETKVLECWRTEYSFYIDSPLVGIFVCNDDFIYANYVGVLFSPLYIGVWASSDHIRWQLIFKVEDDWVP